MSVSGDETMKLSDIPDGHVILAKCPNGKVVQLIRSGNKVYNMIEVYKFWKSIETHTLVEIPQ
jgi:hypothetical protein